MADDLSLDRSIDAPRREEGRIGSGRMRHSPEALLVRFDRRDQ
jgi:hypothetical protein